MSAPNVKSSVANLIAARMSKVAGSASNAAGARARELAAQGRHIVNLTLGEPDFDTPENIRRAAIRAIETGDTRYTTADGTPALKAAVVEKFRRENGLNFATNEVTVGGGAKQIVFNALLATVEDGDEVIVPAPYWVSYPEMVRLVGGTPVPLVCGQNQSFKLRPEQLEEAITPRTKWLILNSPGNPAGGTYTRAELIALAEVLARHPQVWVMTDDIYEHINYQDEPFATMAQTVPEMAARTLTINGVSKAYCMTGWRIGFAGGPKGLIAEMAKIQSQSTSNPSSISQAAAIEALLGPQDHVAEHAAIFRQRRDLIVGELSKVPGLSCASPQGAFYVFPSCAGVIGKRTPDGQLLETDTDFMAYMLECGVAGLPGAPYGVSPHFRLSFAASNETLLDGCNRIREACEALRD